MHNAGELCAFSIFICGLICKSYQLRFVEFIQKGNPVLAIESTTNLVLINRYSV
jgi:hypothetical protein